MALDVIFDIDGTLADATHRLPFIKDKAHWVAPFGKDPRPNWEAFLSDDEIWKDSPIPQTWSLMTGLLRQGWRVLFITGRPLAQMTTTWNWLTTHCPIRSQAADGIQRQNKEHGRCLYMRPDGDRRPSHMVKKQLLQHALDEGFRPSLVFEDRLEDTRMWREEGLRCCQVAEGDY